MKKIRVLYFMPDPPTRKNHGNRTHTMQLLEYFNKRSDFFDLDYMALKEWDGWNETDERDFHKAFPRFGLILGNKKMPKNNKIKYFFSDKLPNKARKRAYPYNNQHIDDHTTLQLQKDFNRQIQVKNYDVIIISYVTWARLVDNNPLVKNKKLIIDTHDFMTGQFKAREGFELGKTFEREVQILSMFDEIWSQSFDEKYLFSQFVPAVHRVIPIMYKKNYYKIDERYREAKYDIIYVGSDNLNNKKSVKWFFDNVYPLLPKNIKICVVGLICSHIPDLPNVEKHLFVPDLNDLYHQSRIAICPMLDGTGIKVKVVEAMSFGLPVVCNTRGLDGLPLKEENGCLCSDNAEQFAFDIEQLLTDEELYITTSNEAVRLFNKYFTKAQGYKYLDEVFDIADKKKAVVQVAEAVHTSS